MLHWSFEKAKFEDLVINVQVTEADPLPTVITNSLNSLVEIHSQTDLEPLPINILDNDYSYSIYGEIYNPSGYFVKDFQQVITPNVDGGVITIENETMMKLIEDLGPGLSTLKLHVLESDYYKPSPTITVPIEVIPPNYLKFGEKNMKIDLIDPFINAYGSSYFEDDVMPFESNYPYLLGTLWVEPDFNGPAGEEEFSIQDYINISLDCTIIGETGAPSTFPLRENIMIRPSNYDSLMEIWVGLGPEDAFLMGLPCTLSLRFDIGYNDYDIFEDMRDVEIYLLDLRIETNPSSSNPTTLWSIYDDQFTFNDGDTNDDNDIEITIDEDIVEIGTKSADDTISSPNIPDPEYGIEIDYIFEKDEDGKNITEYSLDPESALLDVFLLSNIAGLAVVARREEGKHFFTFDRPYTNKGIYSLQELSTINFTDPLDSPHEGEKFTVVYQFEFTFEDDKDYGIITLGYRGGEEVSRTTIEFSIPECFLPPSEESRSSAFIRYEDNFMGDGSTDSFALSHSLQGITPENINENIIIYNSQELEETFAPFNKIIVDNYPNIQFYLNGGTQRFPEEDEEFVVEYGIRSPYLLGYGFQKENRPYSDSVRMLYNDEENENKILSSSSADPLDVHTVNNASLFIGLEDSDNETVLELYQVPLLYAPEVNFTFILDPMVMEQISGIDDYNTLEINIYYVVGNEYSTFYSDKIEVPLKASLTEPEIHYNKDLQSIYDVFPEGSIDIKISFSQKGESSHYISHIILEEFDYICDEHLLEMNDRMPQLGYGELDIKAVINTPHYVQLFSKPFLDSEIFPQFPDSPFDLIENSTVTVELENLPHSSLVSLDVRNRRDYRFKYKGITETIDVSEENFFMIPNLAIFTEAYNLRDTVIQSGYINLYAGTGTEVAGAQDHSDRIKIKKLDSTISNYDTYITADGMASSWEDKYFITDEYLTTDKIDVSGSVFYHQLLDLNNDIIQGDTINEILGSTLEQPAEFGIELPYDVSIQYIRSVGDPYDYILGVHGFPYGDNEDHCETLPEEEYEDYVSEYLLFDPSDDISLVYDLSYSLEYAENNSKYLVFYNDTGIVMPCTTDGKFMIDYWADHTFANGFDYEVIENPENATTYIKWNYYATSLTDYKFYFCKGFQESCEFYFPLYLFFELI